MLVLHALAAMLAVWRITELIVLDAITEPLRKRFDYYLLRCSRCVSFWAGGVATVVFFYWPWGNWPFALAWLYLVHLDIVQQRRLQKWPREIVLRVYQNGSVTVERSGVPPDVMVQALTGIASTIRGSVSPKNGPGTVLAGEDPAAQRRKA